jgi:N-acetylneuraminate lyase
LAVGAVGAIGSTYTFAAPVYLEIIKLFRNNNLAAAGALQLKVVDFIRCIIKHPSIAAQRAIMKMLGYDLGDARLPLMPLSTEKFIELKTDLTTVGFFELLEKYKK